MKTTKIFISVLLGFLALALCSCDSAEYRPTDGKCAFVIKKIDGKRQWGLVDNWERTIEYIPCQYDSIFSAYGAPYNIKKLFIAVKDGKMYVWTYRGKQLLGGRAFTSLVSIEQNASHNKSVYGGGIIFHEARTNEGIMFFCLSSGIDWTEVGPAEAVLWGRATFLFKKNGKWGVADNETYKKIIPCIYDSVISVGEVYFWLKKDGKWSAFTKNDQPIKKSTALLNKYLKMPSMDKKQYQREQRSATFRKISIEEASYIAVNPWEAGYISW